MPGVSLDLISSRMLKNRKRTTLSGNVELLFVSNCYWKPTEIILVTGRRYVAQRQ